MPMLSMKTKKLMKPMLETLAITEDAGLSSPTSQRAPRQVDRVIRSIAAAPAW
jgi:hypothetical protein